MLCIFEVKLLNIPTISKVLLLIIINGCTVYATLPRVILHAIYIYQNIIQVCTLLVQNIGEGLWTLLFYYLILYIIRKF